MTQEQANLVKKIFSDWRTRDGYRDYKISAYLASPEILDEPKRVQEYDKTAGKMLEECRKAIEELTAYRAALCEKYNELVTAPTVPVVRLKRERRYGSGNAVYYYLSVYSKNLNTGKYNLIEGQRYEGKQRHEALKAFEDYKKAHPGIIAEKDIEKARWEK